MKGQHLSSYFPHHDMLKKTVGFFYEMGQEKKTPWWDSLPNMSS
jgi:hypothetical protein